MIGADVDGEQRPVSEPACLSDGFLDSLAHTGGKFYGRAIHSVTADLLPMLGFGICRHTVASVMPVDRSALIAVQPGAVAPEGDQIGKWKVGDVVRHGS